MEEGPRTFASVDLPSPTVAGRSGIGSWSGGRIGLGGGGGIRLLGEGGWFRLLWGGSRFGGRGRGGRLRFLGGRAGGFIMPLIPLGRWRGQRALHGSGGRNNGAAIATATSSALFANNPLSRDRYLTSSNFCDWGKLWVGDPGGDLPVVMSLTSQMRGHSGYGDGGCEEDCELSEGEHDEGKRGGGEEGE